MEQSRDDLAAGRPQERALPVWACLVIGAGAAVVGLLPWLATGFRLSVQNLWATDAGPAEMPRALLPFSQYTIPLIIGVLVTGGALAGLCARLLGRRRPRHGALAVAAGVLVVQVVALVQTAATLEAGLRGGLESAVYLAALTGVAVLSVLVGLLALGLAAGAPRGGAVLGLSIGALALGPWAGGLVVPTGTITPSPVALGLDGVVGWLPAVGVGVAIGWAGVKTVERVLGAGCALVLVWLVPAITTAITSSAGSRVLAHDPRQMAEYAREVFVAASTTPALVLPPLLVSLVVAVVVGLAGTARHHLRRSEDVEGAVVGPS